MGNVERDLARLPDLSDSARAVGGDRDFGDNRLDGARERLESGGYCLVALDLVALVALDRCA